MVLISLDSIEMRILSNHIYELNKGVRNMVLYTTSRHYIDHVSNKLTNQNIHFVIQEIDSNKVNVYFGKKECIDAIKLIASKPLNLLTPEEDFILGTMLGYDLCAQCVRFCKMKGVS